MLMHWVFRILIRSFHRVGAMNENNGMAECTAHCRNDVDSRRLRGTLPYLVYIGRLVGEGEEIRPIRRGGRKRKPSGPSEGRVDISYNA